MLQSSGRTLQDLAYSPVPTHLIVSGFLRLSRTFEIYRHAFSHGKASDVFLPHELPMLGGEPDVEGLQALLSAFRIGTGIRSLVVSDPFKKLILKYLDDLEPRAKSIGAVNLVTKKGDRLVGDNLDGEAFVLGVQEELGYRFRKCSMAFFGCGGVSSAVAVKLAPELKRAALIDIRIEEADALAEKLLRINPKIKIELFDRSSEIDFRKYEVFYNGTGLGKDISNENAFLLTPLHAFDQFPPDGYAFDANYIPWEPAFLRRFDVMEYTILNGFSHMIAFTSLHLSMITGTMFRYSTVREWGKAALPATNEASQPTLTSPWQ
ncbi:MAG: hypothetical protein U0136_14355 [Bdellovibrionota bacterium]